MGAVFANFHTVLTSILYRSPEIKNGHQRCLERRDTTLHAPSKSALSSPPSTKHNAKQPNGPKESEAFQRRAAAVASASAITETGPLLYQSLQLVATIRCLQCGCGCRLRSFCASANKDTCSSSCQAFARAEASGCIKFNASLISAARYNIKRLASHWVTKPHTPPGNFDQHIAASP